MMSWTYLIMTVFFIWSSTGYGAEIGREACNCRPAIVRIHSHLGIYYVIALKVQRSKYII